MKEVVLIVLTDGFADWEASYVSAEINKPDSKYIIKTVAIDKEPKVSMGGLQVLPHYSLNEFASITSVAMLIIPGGTGWRERQNQQLSGLVKNCFQNKIPIAAICDATTFLGNNGFLDNHKHTGNTLPYLKQGAPHYRGEAYYVNAQSVSDSFLITANGSAAIEFSKHILEKLGILEGEQLEQWYDIYKKGYLPA
ncbi:glutamine amidotransferase [Paenibacillus sp. LMG 31456]|uniref:Glutamine amidotransferase n=1 Tax=Paenibacillus foliorum TaxID=2654974 RepID=A0A972K639_9BACL|nr:glutamine amidotransferase [Paenibacillus foliorum]